MREYTVGGAGLTVANNSPVSLVMIMPKAAPEANIQIIRAWVGQSANATSAQQRIEHTTQVAAFPTTAVSATPAKLKRTDAVSGIAGATTIAAGTSGINVATEGAGTKTSIFSDTFNVLNGYLWVPTPDEVLVFPAGSLSAYDLQFPTAPAALTLWSFGVNFAER
jgi:hypothetical protein